MRNNLDKHDEINRDVLMFIGRFTTDKDGKYRTQVFDAFLNGGCYWFSYILSIRFRAFNPTIVIDTVANHFACRIDGKVYDICGEVTGGYYEWTEWNKYDDEAHKKRITEYCVDF